MNLGECVGRWKTIVILAVLIVGQGSGSGFMAAAVGTEPRVLWRQGIALLGSPAAAHGLVFSAAADGYLHAFDQATGAERWTARLRAIRFETPLPPVVAGTSVAYANGDGTIQVFSAIAGTEKYRHHLLGGQAKEIIGAEGHAFALTEDGTVTGFNLDTGQFWRHFHGVAPARFSTAALAVTSGVVAMADERLDVTGLDAITGAVRWRESMAERRGPIAAPRGTIAIADVSASEEKPAPAPTRFDRDLKVSATDGIVVVSLSALDSTLDPEHKDTGGLYALDSQSGDERWRAAWRGFGGSLSNQFAGAGLFVTELDARSLIAREVLTGVVRWQSRFNYDLAWRTSRVIFFGAYQGSLLGLSSRGNAVLAIDAGTGERRWEYTFSRHEQMAGVVAGATTVVNLDWQLKTFSSDTCQAGWRTIPPFNKAILAANDMVYAGNNAGAFVAMDGETGEVQWGDRRPQADRPIPLYVTDRIIVGKDVSGNDLFAYDAGRNPDLRWEISWYPGVTASFTSQELGQILVVGAGGARNLLALDPASGVPLWSVALPLVGTPGQPAAGALPEFVPCGEPPRQVLEGRGAFYWTLVDTTHQQIFAVTMPDGDVTRIDARTGEVAWNVLAPEKNIVRTMEQSEREIYLGYLNGVVVALDRQSGAAKWRVAPPVADAPVVDLEWDGSRAVVAYGDGPGTVVSLDGASGSERWRYVSGGGEITALYATEAGVFVATRTALAGLDPATGEERWRHPGAFGVGASPDVALVAAPAPAAAAEPLDVLASDSTGSILYLAAPSALLAIDLATGAELWHLPIALDATVLTFATPASALGDPAALRGTVVADRILYVSGSGTVIAVELPTAA
jgi:outer membrane protein assembly factor BamB